MFSNGDDQQDGDSMSSHQSYSSVMEIQFKDDARDLLGTFYSAIKKAEMLDLRWQDATRHTFATRLVQGGADIYTVQKLGRWGNISMVMRYAHHYPESLFGLG